MKPPSESEPQGSWAGILGALGRLLSSDAARRLAGPGLAALLIKFAGAALGYFMLVAFARLLSPDDYGRFGFMLNLSLVLAAVISLGLPTGILRLWPEHLVKNEQSLARGAMRHGINGLCLAGLALALLALVVTPFGLWQHQTGSQWGLIAIAVSAFAIAFGDFLSNALRALHHTIWSMAPRDIIWRVLSPAAAGAVLFATGQLSAVTAFTCTLVAYAAIEIPQLLKTLQLTRQAAPDAVASANWKAWLPFLLPVWALTILATLIQQFDVVVVGTLLGPAEAGAYFAAQKTANLLGLAMLAGGLVGAPMMAAAFHSGKIAELQRLCRFLSLGISVSTLAGLVLIAVLGPWLLAIFDESYASAFPVLLVLSLGYTIDSLGGPNSYLLQMTGLERPYLVILTVVYALVLALQLIFIPHYGMMAAAAANATGSILWNVATVILLRKRVGVDPSALCLFKKA